jgi:predicted nuclease of predicted toxin-antitoxin system
MQPKFYMDENVPLAVSKALKTRGVDVLTVQEASMSQRNDKAQLTFAIGKKRAVVTHDSDFLNLVAKEKMDHYGIVFLTQQVKIGKTVEEIEKIHLAFSAQELKSVVLFLPG